MRDYKFRGKDFDGVWRYGLLIKRDLSSDCWIREFSVKNEPPRYIDYQVDPESVGQYIEKKDKSSVEIYEKDIVERNGVRAEVVWDNTRILFTVHPLLANSLRPDAQVLILPSCEVIGNTIDNLSLLII